MGTLFSWDSPEGFQLAEHEAHAVRSPRHRQGGLHLPKLIARHCNRVVWFKDLVDAPKQGQ
jgi:hypothetical protein